MSNESTPGGSETRKPGWINRNKRMPPPNTQVLVSIKYGAGNRSHKLSYCTERFPDVFDDFSDGTITHWRHLPKHPKP